MKKSEYLDLFIKTRQGSKRAQKSLERTEKILRKNVPPKEFKTIGTPQLKRMKRLVDKLLTEADQLHEKWLNKKAPRT